MSYYDTLKLNRDANINDIRRSYYNLAERYHPRHRLQTDSSLDREFMRLSEAFDVLSDPHKRQIYNEHGAVGLNSSLQRGVIPNPLSGVESVYSNFAFNEGLDSMFTTSRAQSLFDQNFEFINRPEFTLDKSSTFVVPSNSTFVHPSNSTFVHPSNSTFVHPSNSTFIHPSNSTFVTPTHTTFVEPTHTTLLHPTNTTFIEPTHTTLLHPTNTTNTTFVHPTNTTFINPTSTMGTFSTLDSGNNFATTTSKSFQSQSVTQNGHTVSVSKFSEVQPDGTVLTKVTQNLGDGRGPVSTVSQSQPQLTGEPFINTHTQLLN